MSSKSNLFFFLTNTKFLKKKPYANLKILQQKCHGKGMFCCMSFRISVAIWLGQDEQTMLKKKARINLNVYLSWGLITTKSWQ